MPDRGVICPSEWLLGLPRIPGIGPLLPGTAATNEKNSPYRWMSKGTT